MASLVCLLVCLPAEFLAASQVAFLQVSQVKFLRAPRVNRRVFQQVLLVSLAVSLLWFLRVFPVCLPAEFLAVSQVAFLQVYQV